MTLALILSDRLRVDVLRGVLSRCRHESIPVTGGYGDGDVRGLLQTIGIDARSVVVLVDVLGFSYDEAARVLSASRKHVMRMLAHARLHLAKSRSDQIRCLSVQFNGGLHQ